MPMERMRVRDMMVELENLDRAVAALRREMHEVILVAMDDRDWMLKGRLESFMHVTRVVATIASEIEGSAKDCHKAFEQSAERALSGSTEPGYLD